MMNDEKTDELLGLLRQLTDSLVSSNDPYSQAKYRAEQALAQAERQAERQAAALERIAKAQEQLVIVMAASIPEQRAQDALKALNDLDKRTGEQS